MPDWLIWLIAAGVFAAAEATSLSLVLLMFAGGATAASVVAAIGAPVVVQFLVAIVGTLALLGAVRPIAQRHLSPKGSAITGSAALVGQEAIVLAQVDAVDGRVRLNGGEWSARCFDERDVLPAGTVVRVMKINGATAVVLRDESNGSDVSEREQS